MIDLLSYMEPPSDALKQYARTLYMCRGEGIIVPRKVIGAGEWMPAPNLCHENVEELASRSEGFEAVHGWLYFDFGGFLPFVRFVAHSVVVDKNGAYFDITPLVHETSQYPFLPANVSVDLFKAILTALCDVHPIANLDHWLSAT